jgi:hypothetical protein
MFGKLATCWITLPISAAAGVPVFEEEITETVLPRKAPSMFTFTSLVKSWNSIGRLPPFTAQFK